MSLATIVIAKLLEFEQLKMSKNKQHMEISFEKHIGPFKTRQLNGRSRSHLGLEYLGQMATLLIKEQQLQQSMISTRPTNQSTFKTLKKKFKKFFSMK